ncbi:YfcE family phosphodiesterase [Sulfurimonas sp. MAG313]|nr:YfcE family phosphodiesterase [Sulfurimonas sp. MAG313]MDF1881774.1 YfcE family phosphodiesterase [Sulfurimonas sp. MAG313]
MKIGILSDTHTKTGRAKKVIDLLIENGAQYLIHAGDICEVEVLQYLAATKLPYIAVYGNNDAHMVEHHRKFNLVQEPHLFKIDDIKFKLMHLPYYLNPDDADIIIFGHTHMFECDFKADTLFINPGESCARNKPVSECVLLEINDDKYSVTSFNRALKTKMWNTQHMNFERLA